MQRFEEYKIHIQTPLGRAPALVIEPLSKIRKAAVLVYPGLGAEKEVQRGEMLWLAEAGFTAVGIDAPHHGERRDGHLEKMARMSESEARYAAMNLVRDAIMEIPAIIDECWNRFTQRVGIAGISIGGFITYGAVIADRRILAAAPVLGSPEWVSPELAHSQPEMKELWEQAPARFPEKFFPCALLAANAGKDTSVAAESSREFACVLKKYYINDPQRLKYLDYPESGHTMREQDWNDVWKQIISWFEKYLVRVPDISQAPLTNLE